MSYDAQHTEEIQTGVSKGSRSVSKHEVDISDGVYAKDFKEVRKVWDKAFREKAKREKNEPSNN